MSPGGSPRIHSGEDVTGRGTRRPDPDRPRECRSELWSPRGSFMAIEPVRGSGTTPRAARMTITGMSNLLARFLSEFSDGSVEVDLDSAPLASLDARSRNLDLQIAPFLGGDLRARSIMREGGPAGLWNARKIPRELARQGWRLTLYDGSQELLALGRGTSALSGHVRVRPAAQWKLRKLV